MKLNYIVKITAISSIALLMSGCVTSQNLPIASASNLATGNALIKVERESGFMGGGRSAEVTDNGKVVGNLSQGKSLAWQRKAGKMALNLTPSFAITKKFPPIIENVQAGKTYEYKVYLSKPRASLIIEEK